MKIKKGTILKWACLTLIATYCVVITVWAHGEAARHICNGIEISVLGDPRMKGVVEKGVRQELSRYPRQIVNAPINSINTGDIREYLSRLSNFESVSCMMSSAHTLKVEIVPLIPVMRVFAADNSYYINKDGKHIESKPEFYTDVPSVTGNFSRTFPPSEVLPLVKFIESDETLRDLTGMIVARDRNNLLVVPRIRGHIINFGDTNRLEAKRDALLKFYNKVMPYKGWQEYDTISVKFRGQVVATRRIKPVAPVTGDSIVDIDPDELTLPDHLVKTDAAANDGTHAADSAKKITTP